MGAPAPPLLRRGATVGAICLALAAPACVVPVGPQFQDPPATQNYEPRILAAQPPLGERVTGTTFHVTVQDPNVLDDRSPMQPANPLQLPDEARRVMGTWTLDLECPP